MNKIQFLFSRSLYFLPVFSAIYFMSCSGSSYLTTLKIKANTHPVKEYGDIYILYKGGLIYHGNSVLSQVGSGDFNGEKKIGRACSTSYLSLISHGDSSVQNVCNTEKITKILSVQHDITALGAGLIYQRHCTVVVGVSDGTWEEPKFIFIE